MKKALDVDYKQLLSLKEEFLSKEHVSGHVARLLRSWEASVEKIERINEEISFLEDIPENVEKEQQLLERMRFFFWQIALIRFKLAFFLSETRESYEEEVDRTYELFRPVMGGAEWFEQKYQLFRDFAKILELDTEEPEL